MDSAALCVEIRSTHSVKSQHGRIADPFVPRSPALPTRGVASCLDQTVMTVDEASDWLEKELENAPKTLTGDLYHYTSSEAAILGILANRTIRLSPFQGTNDLWESRPLLPNLEGQSSVGELSMDETDKIWDDIDRFIRGYSKVACFTQDWELPETVINSDAMRGWSHLSMWAHYGERHAGVCLRFNKARLLSAFDAARGDAVHQFSGEVHYRAAELGVGPYGISIEQAEEFGVDAVALRYAYVHRDRVFFRKHADWAPESEFRLVRTDLSLDPFYLDISGALTGVVLGDGFPMNRLPALHSMLDGFGDIELSQIRFHNRVMNNFPLELPVKRESIEGAAPTVSSTITPRREGILRTRLELLNQSEREAAAARAAASSTAALLAQVWASELTARREVFDNWPDVTIRTSPSVHAIPAERRCKRPGVESDVCLDQGCMFIVEHQPQYSYTFVAAVALQMVVGGAVRLYACITIEEWLPQGNDRRELWRVEREVASADATQEAGRLMVELIEEIPNSRRQFDQLRGR